MTISLSENKTALAQQRGAIVDQMRVMLDAAESEGRDLSRDEDKRYQDYQAQVDALSRRIDRLDGQAHAEAVANAVTEPAFRPPLSSDYQPTSSQFRDHRGNEVRMAAKGEQLSDGYNGPHIGHIIQAMLAGTGSSEVRAALERGSDAAGGVAIDEHLFREQIDNARSASQVVEAGARVLSMPEGVSHMIKIASDPVAGWRAEGAALAVSEPTFQRVSLEAKSLAVSLRVTRELMQDGVDVPGTIRRLFTQALADELDRACLLGEGTNAPTGLVGQAGVQTIDMGVDGGTLTGWDEAFDALELLQQANHEPSAMIGSVREYHHYARLTDSQGNWLPAPPAFASVRFLPSTKTPVDEVRGTATNASKLFIGDFSKLIIGMRESATLELHRDRYADTGEFLITAHMRADVAVTHGPAFVIVDGIIPA